MINWKICKCRFAMLIRILDDDEFEFFCEECGETESADLSDILDVLGVTKLS